MPDKLEAEKTAADRILAGVLKTLTPVLIGSAVALMRRDREPEFLAFVGAGVVVVSVGISLRKLPGKAPLRVWAQIGLPAIAVLLLVAAPFLRGVSANIAMLAAGCILTIALLITEDSERRDQTLLGTTVIGFGAAVSGFAVGSFGGPFPASYLAVVTVLGLAIIGLGAAILTKPDLLPGVALIGAGLAIVALGVTFLVVDEVVFLTEGDWLGAISVIAGGAAAVGFGVAVLVGRDWPLGLAFVSGGLALAGLGIATLVELGWAGGWAVVGFAIAAIGFGVATLLRRALLRGVAITGFGLSAVGLGIAVLLEESVLLAAVALLGVGAALIAKGASEILNDDGFKEQLHRLRENPDSVDSQDGQ